MKKPSVTAVYSHMFIVADVLNHILPKRVKFIVGDAITSGSFLAVPSLRRAIIDNLEPVLPGTTRSERWRHAHRIVLNYSRYIADYLDAFMSGRPGTKDQYFSEVSGGEHFEAALKRDAGVLIVTPHLGHWELGLLVLENYHRRMAVITAPIASQRMRRKIEHFRQTLGIEVVTLEDPAEYMFVLKRLLMEKKIVSLLVDRYVSGSFDTIPFFGRPAKMPVGYLHLARILQTPIVPCFIVRNDQGMYSCMAEPPLLVEDGGDRDSSVHRALGQIMASFEKAIRKYVHQWYRFTPVWEPQHDA